MKSGKEKKLVERREHTETKQYLANVDKDAKS